MLHLSLFDWRVAMGIGLLFGIVIGTAPQMIGTLLLLGVILGVIKLVDKNRL
jgi:F0F1-type ATP synthase assembly protein I